MNDKGKSLLLVVALGAVAWYFLRRQASTSSAPSGPAEKVNILGNIGGLTYTNDKNALKDLSAMLADQIQIDTTDMKTRFAQEANLRCGPDWKTRNVACANSILGQLWSGTYAF